MTISATKAKELGRMVAAARARTGMSTRQLAPLLGISNSWITKLEQGQYLDPSPALLAKVVDVLDIDPQRVDRLMPGALAASLPSLRTYFRIKHAVTPAAAEQIARYADRLVDPPRSAA